MHLFLHSSFIFDCKQASISSAGFIVCWQYYLKEDKTIARSLPRRMDSLRYATAFSPQTSLVRIECFVLSLHTPKNPKEHQGREVKQNPLRIVPSLSDSFVITSLSHTRTKSRYTVTFTDTDAKCRVTILGIARYPRPTKPGYRDNCSAVREELWRVSLCARSLVTPYFDCLAGCTLDTAFSMRLISLTLPRCNMRGAHPRAGGGYPIEDRSKRSVPL